MKRVVIIPLLLIALGCNSEKKSTVNKIKMNDIGSIVLILAKANPAYTKEKAIELSRAIDPMVDQFDGYFGRKMIFGVERPDLMGDIVFYENVDAFEKASEVELKSETCQKFFRTMLQDSETSKMLVLSPVFITTNSEEKANTVEIALFEVKPEFNQKEVISAAKSINPVLENFEGFVSRKLAVTEDGQWADILYWNSLENAERAFQKVMKNEICQSFFNMLDNEKSEFMHFDIAIDTER